MWHWYSDSVKGRKTPVNQDCLSVTEKGRTLSATVCDGIGGTKGGEVASRLCVEKLTELIFSSTTQSDRRSLLVEAVRSANHYLYDYTLLHPEYQEMGTTLITLLLNENRAYFISVGDSRMYSFTKDCLRQLTEDDSYVWRLYKENLLTKEQLVKHPKGNLVTKIIPMGMDIQVVAEETDIKGDTVFLLCSDGVTDYLQDKTIENIIKENERLTAIGEKIITESLKEGSNDDISLILLSNYLKE